MKLKFTRNSKDYRKTLLQLEEIEGVIVELLEPELQKEVTIIMGS